MGRSRIYEWDDAKAEANRAKHGVRFEEVFAFDWDVSLTALDFRRQDEETRYITMGPIRERIYVLVWTPRGALVRIISLRKANSREVERYAEQD